MSGYEQTAPHTADLRVGWVAVAAWGGAWWGAAPTRGWGLLLAAATAVLALRLHHERRTSLAWGVLLCLVVSAALAAARHHQLVGSPVGQWGQQKAMATVTLRLTTDVRQFPSQGAVPASAVVDAHTVQVQARGHIIRQRATLRVRATGDLGDQLAQIPAGSLLRVEGRLGVAQPGRGHAAELMLRAPPTMLQEPRGWRAGVNRIRAGLRDSMRHSPPLQAGLLPSLVVGDTSGLDPQLEEDFRATGLTHLTAVSGTNLTLMLVFGSVLVRSVGLRGWWVRGSALLGVVAFVVLCRAEPSVVRAGAMGLVALGGLGRAGGTGRGLRHLCVAIWFLVLVDPWLARSMGFALSVCATAGILWWGQRWTAAMSWAPAWCAEAVTVPLAAQLATQPLVTSISDEVSVVGLVANALAGPFVGPATVAGLAAATVSVVSPPAASWVGWVAGWCVQPVVWTAQWGASLPAATWRWPASAPMLVALGALCLAAAPLVPEILARRVACLVAAGAMALACWRAPRPLGWPGPWQVAFCDVGQGDATVLRSGPGQAVLVDAGPDGATTVGCLQALGVKRLSAVVLSHYHDDHIAGLAAVLREFPTEHAVVNPVQSPVWAAREVQSLLAEATVPARPAAVGLVLSTPQARLEVVGVGASGVLAQAGEGESSAENDSSIVLVARLVDGLAVVLGGDVEPAGQQKVVADGWQPRAQVLKMPHHGSARQDRQFWCGSQAVVAVASAGYRNRHRHPAPTAVRLAQECGMRVLRTDLAGTVTLWLEGNQLQVRTERDGPP
ncbi:ComEC/Rec2 family competence protein [Luteococcus sp. OSA5]|uniref:ComEC/Rec2 family competence protein n=1 Tax=Luteococcus sp. OSA5 TaxID=3401630 RepID=UPI003B42F446